MEFKELNQETYLPASLLYQEVLDAAPYSFPENNEGVIAAMFHRADCKYFTVHDGKDFLGLVGVESINWIDRTCQPIIALDPEQRGKSTKHAGMKLSQKVAREFRELLTGTLNLRRIYSVILATSPAVSILKALDFQEEGTLKEARFLNGEYVDALAFGWVAKE